MKVYTLYIFYTFQPKQVITKEMKNLASKVIHLEVQANK